jgi:hypothetical protein
MHYFHITETGSGKGSTLTTRKHREKAFEKAEALAAELDKPVAVWNSQASIWERTYFPSGAFNIGYNEVEPAPSHPVRRRRPNPAAHHTPESAIMAQALNDGHVHHEKEG